MNQILIQKSKPVLKAKFNSEISFIENDVNLLNNRKENTILKFITKNRYPIQFFVSATIAIIFIFILVNHIYKIKENEKISKKLLNNYSLITLYQNQEDDFNIEKQSTIVENPFVIGIIKIPSINLNYPILSESNKDLLKISLCRFAGPMPNEYGNLCIAGHNFVDNKFFSNLAELEIKDLIEIYDLHGQKIDYVVFNKYEVKPTDFSCANQNTKERIITLITCNNVNGKRTVVQAKPKNNS